MANRKTPLHAALPSVDRMIRQPALQAVIEQRGQALVTDVVREVLAELRADLNAGDDANAPAIDAPAVIQRVTRKIEVMFSPRLKPVRNLTGTVLHTNLGRSPLPLEAIEAMTLAASVPTNLEYDLDDGHRGDRDSHLEDWLVRLSGAEAATVVNNNAAAVLLVLNTLALRREVIVSRGELIEIGGSFRLPVIMARSGCRLCEVGTTNRTHAADYENAVSSRTALIMKAHTSNYQVRGFTSAVGEKELAGIAHDNGLPLAVDLGSGTLVPLERYGLPAEPTVAAIVKAGADLVTFSGDKLLGGPQAGIIVGRKDLVARIKRNPFKRALRIDKLTLAALDALLPLYADPDRLPQRLPALGLLVRPETEIRSQAGRVATVLAERLEGIVEVTVVSCMSQIGSGALPLDTLPSAAIAMRPLGTKRIAPKSLRTLAAAFRALPTPTIGRIHDGVFHLDLRCLADEAAFVQDIAAMELER